jgi:hypothetical protein
MLMVFVKPKEIVVVNVLPQGTWFTAIDFVDNAIIPLVNRYSQPWGDIARRKLHLHFDNSKCHTTRDVQKQMANHRWIRAPQPPYLPDLAIADFCLFGRLNQQLSGRTLDGEQNVFKAVTEILNAFLKDEAKSVFLHWKERCQWVADHNGELDGVSHTKCSIFSAERNYVKQFHELHRVKAMNYSSPFRNRKGLIESEMCAILDRKHAVKIFTLRPDE